MSDYIVHASGAGNQVRIFAASTRDLVEKAREIHNTSPVATAALGRLLTAGAMMGSMMKGEKDLLTLQIQCSGPIGGLTVTAKSDGTVKGYVNNPDVMLPPNSKGKLDVGGALDLGVLSVIKDMGMKEPYVGQTQLVSGEIAEDLTYYYATSEQINSSVALGVLMEKNNTQKGIVQFAMEAGAYMGLYFVVKFIFAVLSLNYPFCNVVSTIMLLFVPLVVFFMMRRFSNQNEGGSYFSQLWMMGILLFFFASLISGLAQYIYYVYINPEYIKSQLSAAVTLLESLNMTSDPSLLEAVKTGLEQGNIPSPMAVVIQQMWVNVFFGSLLSAVMAWLVSVWFKSSKTKK